MNPHLSKKPRISSARPGNKLNKIFDPSSGGIGTRLKIASSTFMSTATNKSWTKESERDSTGASLITIDNTRATAIFEAGPAIATSNSPHLLFRRLYGLYGTGFAQPKMSPPGRIANIRGRITEPKGSKCFSGFSVRRPSYFAVVSPKNKAAYPCETS